MIGGIESSSTLFFFLLSSPPPCEFVEIKNAPFGTFKSKVLSLIFEPESSDRKSDMIGRTTLTGHINA